MAPPAPTPVAPPAPAAQEMAVVNSSTDMTAAVPGGGAMVEALEKMGFAGLDFGFGSLPLVSLDQGAFKMSDGTSLGEEFYCMMKQSRPKYLFKTALAQNDPRHDLCYSYDGVTDTKGSPVEDKIRAWERMGISYEKKSYLEVFATLVNGDTVLLSIPPTSVRRFSGLIGSIVGKGLSVEDTWVKVFKGPKVTNVAVPFTPWGFEVYTG